MVHDGFGVWCATHRLNQRRFAWPSDGAPLQQPHSHRPSSMPSLWACRGSGSHTCRPSRACDGV
ncbi:hypothetical protein [Acidovorax sp. LjRoot66]|uniref:hypothetical protein n=1 Tax=Acidovorax sp. LjRoot66 TaxID=3342334 RepID=UPI003F4FDF73